MKLSQLRQIIREELKKSSAAVKNIAYIKIAINDDSSTVDNSYIQEKISNENQLKKFLIKYSNDLITSTQHEEYGPLWIQACAMLNNKFYEFENDSLNEITEAEFNSEFGPESNQLNKFEK